MILVDYITDVGIIFQDYQVLKSFYINNISYQNFNDRTGNNELLYLRITLNHLKKNFHREFQKIQTSLANIGGIL